MRLGRRESVVIGAAHVVAAAATDQLAAAALQPCCTGRTPQAGVFLSAIAPDVKGSVFWGLGLCGLVFSDACRWHDGQPISLPAADSSAFDAHLIECTVRQNHR
jgi:hypothetical protein